LDKTLHGESFEDLALNGLQVEGSSEVKKVAVAVDSGLSIIKQAVELSADFLFVHHGIFWGRVNPVTGVYRKVLGELLENDLSLFASHLPLDAHPQFGNNFGLARLLSLTSIESAINHRGKMIGAIGWNELSFEELLRRLKELPGGDSPIAALRFGPERPNRVAVVTGAAADTLMEFETEGFDTLITGEPKQFAYHFCKERGLNAIFAGHYRTETVGVRLIAEEIERRFKLPFQFIDEPTGI
jgi:dinuclear metal center YbgI/SA1388 family protein